VIAPGVPFDEITDNDLISLVENGYSERRTVEYKRELPGGSDADRREFLADASSFANASGGDLLFGVDEDEGVPTRIVPQTGSADAAKLAWESSIRDGVSPRIPGIQVRAIQVEGGYVLHLRIPRSWAAPHAVTYKGSFRFYGRTSAGKYPLDVSQLRAAFLGGAEIADRIRAFRVERVASILAGEAPVPLVQNPKVILHLVPYEAFGATPSLELNATEGSGMFRPPFDAYPGTTRWNIDGLLTLDRRSDEDGAASYAQLFRSGIYEGVDAHMITTDVHDNFRAPFVYGYWLEKALNRDLANPLHVLQRIGVQPPVVVLVTVVGINDYLMLAGQQFLGQSAKRFHRDIIALPDIVLDQFPANPRDELPLLMRPSIDAFWQAGGWPQSPDYDDDGAWREER
jgi:hypothetical protein